MDKLIIFVSPKFGEQTTGNNFVLTTEFEDWLTNNSIRYIKKFDNFLNKCSIIFSSPKSKHHFCVADILLINEMSFDQIKTRILSELWLLIENIQKAKDTVTIIYNSEPITMYRDDFIEFIYSHKIN